MEEDNDRFQSIVTNSNLVATAEEFIPRSLANLTQIASDVQQNVYNFSNASNKENFSFQGPGTFMDSCGSAMENGSTLNFSLNDPSVLEYSVVGECSSSSSEYPSNLVYGNSQVYLPNRECKFAYDDQNNSNSRWNRSNFFDESQSLGHEIEKERCQELENQKKYKNYYVRSNRKFKPSSSNGLTKNNFSDKNEATHSKSDDQQNHHLDYKNISWRYKDRFGKTEQQPQYKEKVNAGVSFGSENFSKKGGPSKGGDQSEVKQNQKSFHSKNLGIKISQKKKMSNDIGQVTSQREQLIHMLIRGILECLVCCEVIYQNSSVWSCSNCYHVLHLKCTIKWAKSSKSDFGWRCPACQNVTTKIPNDYYCFCGKLKDPEWNRVDCPHSCGEVCGKYYRKLCPHKCTLLCHPGPCPQCTVTVVKSCGCQQITKPIKCGDSEEVVCNKLCEKKLNCQLHTCPRKCHQGECQDCSEVITQVCFCKKNHREVKCTIQAVGNEFSCGNVCEKKLTCGHHACSLLCHEGECPKCEVTPELVKFCPCGKTELTSLNAEKRSSCIDPIPTCDLICGKELNCGPLGRSHTCQMKCHEGACPECSLETMVKCRCGHKDKTVPCRELNARSGDVLCDKRCTKKRRCGKHKCNLVCCTGADVHECPLPCNRTLQCGLHRCEETCHKGHCKPCLHASFEELSCECGAEVIFPPVPCGTRPPQCQRPCTRVHACGHTPVHTCHSASQCPPCTVLTKKYCHGRHELRKAVPCHQDSFSCGLPCGKEVDCGRHKCILTCHPGPCLKQDQSCTQPCTVPRPACGHICASPCHDGSCPLDVPCKEMVRVTCECSHRFTTRICHENAKEFQRIASAKIARKMAEMQFGQSINLNDAISKKISYETLECNDECKLIERNRRLAIALQIRNPDLSAKLTPRYSENLKRWAKKDARFCQMVHDKLTDLVQLAKQSKQKSRSYSFDPMNLQKRQFIHEYCEHFGCESVAYDQEPKRNVVATALKDKSWLPSMSLLELVQKENSPRKVPVPVISKTTKWVPQMEMKVLSSKILGSSQQPDSAGDGSGMSGGTSEPQIDYFDWKPQNT